MNESIFKQEIRESLNFFNPACHYEKIPDPSSGFNQTVKRPYDGYYVYKDKFIAFEYKMIKQPNSFPFDKVEDHQIYNLLKAKQSFNEGFVLINYRFSFSQFQMDKYETNISKNNFTFLIDISDFVQLKYLYEKFLLKKSIPFEYVWDLKKNNSNSIIEWMKIKDKWVWNISKILEII